MHDAVLIRANPLGRFILIHACLDLGLVWSKYGFGSLADGDRASEFESYEAARSCAQAHHLDIVEEALSARRVLCGDEPTPLGQFHGNREGLNQWETLVSTGLVNSGVSVLRGGWPDLFCELPIKGEKSLVFGVEVKSQRDQLSQVQIANRALLKLCGVPVCVIHHPQELEAELKRLLKQRIQNERLDRIVRGHEAA